MTRHKWQDDTCTTCGLRREKRLRRKLVKMRPTLGKDKRWYLQPIYLDNLDWHYGQHGFDRPDCKK